MVDVQRQDRSGGRQPHNEGDTWYVHSRPKISRDVLNPEIRSAYGTLVCLCNKPYIFPATSVQICTSLHALSPYPGKQQTRAHYS